MQATHEHHAKAFGQAATFDIWRDADRLREEAHARTLGAQRTKRLMQTRRWQLVAWLVCFGLGVIVGSATTWPFQSVDAQATAEVFSAPVPPTAPVPPMPVDPPLAAETIAVREDHPALVPQPVKEKSKKQVKPRPSDPLPLVGQKQTERREMVLEEPTSSEQPEPALVIFE